jgi:ACS family glucarate transporter-like MFS transporter
MRELLRGRLRWLLVAWMFAISATAYLDRVNISIAGPILQKEFGLSNTQLGWVFSAFVVGYALFQVPGGRLADRYGPRRTLLFATIWWAVFTSITAMVPSGVAGALLMLLSVRLALGLGEAVVYPSSNRLVSKWIPTTERGVANGVIFAGVGIGAGVTPPLVTYILTHYGWHWTFWISAVIGLVIGAVWFFLARDEPEQHPWVTQEEVRTIKAGLPIAATTTNAPALHWTQLTRSRSVMAMSLSYFAYGYTAYIYFTWFFIYLTKVRGMDLKSSAILGMLPFLAMAVGSPLGGTMSDFITRHWGRRNGRCVLGAVSMGVSAVFLAFGPLAATPQMATVLLAGGAGALYFSQSSFWSVSADISGPSAGVLSGFMNMGNQIGGALTASLTPILANYFGWSFSFLVAAVLCGAGALAWLLVDPTRVVGAPAVG